MTNKFFALLVSLFVIAACAQQSNNNSEIISSEDSAKICVNPNGDSELAVLMRSMYSHLSSIRQTVIDLKLTGSYPNFIDSIYNAKPTDSTMVDSEFPARAKEYVAAVNDLYHRYPESQPVAYDVVVSKCESCHLHYCPGPLDKIRKLYIKK